MAVITTGNKFLCCRSSIHILFFKKSAHTKPCKLSYVRNMHAREDHYYITVTNMFTVKVCFPMKNYR